MESIKNPPASPDQRQKNQVKEPVMFIWHFYQSQKSMSMLDKGAVFLKLSQR